MIHNILVDLIDDVIKSRADKHGWESGLFTRILQLSADQRGEIGERLVEDLLKKAGIAGVTRAGKTDRTKKHWDIKTADMTVEVKTATLGRNINTFQHESIEKDRDYDVLVFVDIAPNAIYISWHAKNQIPWKNLHRRAIGVMYKWDTNLNTVKENEVKTINDIKVAYAKTLEEISG